MLRRSELPAGHFEQRDPGYCPMSGEQGALYVLNVITGFSIAVQLSREHAKPQASIQS